MIMGSRIGTVAAVLVFAVGLFLPLVYVAAHGWTLTGFYEESLGYRYFYSLRLLYGKGEYVYGAQGQLVDIVNEGIQRGLTAAGYRPDVLFPRIDLFAYATVGVAHLLAVAAFAWAVGPLPTALGKVSAALFWLLIYYAPGISTLHNLIPQSVDAASPLAPLILQPDYHTWVLSLGLLTAGTLGRWCNTTSPLRLRDSLGLGVFAGLAATVKLTLLIFPATLGVAWIIGRRPVSRSIGMALAAAGIGQLVWFAVLLGYYRGDLTHLGRYFDDLSTFLSGAMGRGESYGRWLDIVAAEAHWAAKITVVLSILLPVVVLLFVRGAPLKALLPCLLGLGAHLWLLHTRFVTAAWLESAIFLQMAVWVVIVHGRREPWPFPWRGAATAALILPMVFFVYAWIPHLQEIGINDRIGRHLWRLLSDAPPRIAFLILDNRFRLLSVDMSIAKGGSDIFRGKYESALVKRLVPEREYFLQLQHWPHGRVDPDQFSTAVFALPRGLGVDKKSHIAYLTELSSIPLFLFRCDREVDLVYQVVVICTRRGVVGHGP